jgi:hypothetical protein
VQIIQEIPREVCLLNTFNTNERFSGHPLA